MARPSSVQPVAVIGVLWHGDPRVPGALDPESSRLRDVFRALAARGVAAEPLVYSDDVADEVRARLLQLDGVLVWVNPIMEDGRDRARLDALLREASARGVWVSAHPDVILAMGTKEVLVRTRDMGWGTDTHVYRTARELREQLPRRLASGRPRVLKQNRGNGGNGVWKVELAGEASRALGLDSLVRILHALRGSVVETMSLRAFIKRCEAYFSAQDGLVVDQPFQERLADGMVRCYLTEDKVVGFGHQFVKALRPPPPPDSGPEAWAVPPRLYYGPEKPEFQALKGVLESEWVPAMQRLQELGTTALPVLWDADFLYGPKTPSGEDTYVLCEINVSSVYPFPSEAVAPMADAAIARVLAAREAKGEG